MAKIETGAVKADLLQVANGSRAAMERVAKGSTSWNATLRTTCVATMLEGGHAMNALPQLAAATVNCRVLPDDSKDFVAAAIRKVVADTQVAVTLLGNPAPGPASPLRPDVLQAVTSITDQMWPGVITLPMMVMGATDGRALRAAGIPTYGIQGFFIDRDDVRFHGRDERMRVQSFYEGHAFLYELVKRLSRSTTTS
jgi:acetylornithine deacetylase/succinyl-diaminopimelate desuccinylase-like protein